MKGFDVGQRVFISWVPSWLTARIGEEYSCLSPAVVYDFQRTPQATGMWVQEVVPGFSYPVKWLSPISDPDESAMDIMEDILELVK